MKRVTETGAYEELRRNVRELCASYPDEYWRELDAERRYPEEFVGAMTEAGYLAALIPEEYGGMGLDLSGACAILEGSTAAAPTPVPPTPRCTRWARSSGTARRSKKRSIYRE
jgi:alkylation response protein AidB-like acyl-CoA dehydrogenase